MKLKNLTTASLAASVLYGIIGIFFFGAQAFLLKDTTDSPAGIILMFAGFAVGAYFVVDAIRLYSRTFAIRNNTPRLKSVEDRFDELERLKRRDMVSPEEYAAKRQEILKDL